MSNNASVAHSFAYGNNDKGSNFYSENKGILLYSYSSLLARKFDNGIILISEPISRYSTTSQKHHHHLLWAINHREYYYVSKLDSYGKLEEFMNDEELEVVNKSLIELYKKQKRARKYDYSYQINKEIDKGNAIIKYGSVDKRKAPYKQFINIKDNTNLKELINDSIEAEKIKNKRIAKQKLEANKKRYKEFTGVDSTYKAIELQKYNYLRIRGDLLETSGSVRVDLKEAQTLYKAFKSNKSVVGQKIGYYTILKADKKEVKIGCHIVMVKELDRVLGA